MTLPLNGRTAFVTGAARGLGLAIAEGLAQAGASVALADIDPSVEAAAAALRRAGHAALALVLDVRSETAFDAAFGRACSAFGAIDVLVNNAARTPGGSLWDVSADEWDDVLAINLRGSFFGCRIAGRHMRARGRGRIVNLASVAGQQASRASVPYAASKAGILALTRAFALELAPQGVTVNAIAPSAIHSPLLDALDADRRDALLAATPLGRFGDPAEVADAVVYLASDKAAFMTGATLDLNGGRLMR
ncbi:MAG: SDR family NAD(P)-dependent oxidoreductase [Burkholderiaceae bacterium]